MATTEEPQRPPAGRKRGLPVEGGRGDGAARTLRQLPARLRLLRGEALGDDLKIAGMRPPTWRSTRGLLASRPRLRRQSASVTFFAQTELALRGVPGRPAVTVASPPPAADRRQGSGARE